jgi:hypothetical protein
VNCHHDPIRNVRTVGYKLEDPAEDNAAPSPLVIHA